MMQIDQSIQTTLKERLKEIFGFSQFRGDQETIIHNILAGKNTFVIMPTGAGKSLCYQLPAIASEGTAIVISPLIALMKNQVDQLNAFGINAQFLNSTLSKTEMTKVKKDTLNGTLKLLYIAPESLTKEENLDFLKKAVISFVAIDEAHCISEWGHDFRPEYRKIRGIVDNIGHHSGRMGLPVIALTATATPKVQQDIQKNLNMEDADVFKTSFNRKNLYYEIKPKVDAKKALIKYVKHNKGKSGIVYCLSRKTAEDIAELLRVNDVRALPYHAGLDPQTRIANQDAFLNEEVDVVCATIAFGMGIDKPDVRFVIHYDAPKSLEGYYQETGRAGRDGLEGNCIMFYSYDDIVKLEKFNKDKPVTERDNAKHLLQEMVSYANLGVCRRRQLLGYFGEYMEKDCGFCDNCLKPTPKFKAQAEIILALQTVLQTDQRFDVSHLADVLTATDNQYITSYEHDKLELYGKGKSFSEDCNVWCSLIKQITILGFLEKDVDNYGVLRVTQKGMNYIEDPYPVMLSTDHDYEQAEADAKEEDNNEATAGSGGNAYDEELLGLLKALRKKVAKEKNLPPYVIFQDPSMEEMATTYPTTREEMAQINGVGMGKVQKFGKPFIDLITKYVEENDIETAKDVVVKSTVNKSKIKIYIIQQIDRKIDLDEIAEAKDLTLVDLVEEIEHICYSGTRLNLDYYIDQIIDEDRQDEIFEYFMRAETDNIAVAMQQFQGDDFTEQELRLMRIKFLSEVAN
ncbi:ATP-dependent DNA helicase RecQ [Fibrella aestuarina BUZ 2]|uniref:DNA helicase RecQ n=1 Tax=Fibrella aestuarina BUZ 2 TaxID=1166018 RepID=I0K2G1_9BACT|nr:DNA helicase RecQ [Fibrella aestuarina]CCG98314.1 ATP-dependent DNA helicase RecQ [Fibrella aestuarina BUZ 2]